MDEDCPCDTCDRDCDPWEAQYCCDLCHWQYGDIEPPCDDCDPYNIQEGENK